MVHGIPPRGFRLPALTRLGGVHILVSDLPRSLDYYQNVLGLRLIASDSRGASLGTATSSSPLLHLSTHPGVRATPQGERIGLYHFALVVPDRPALGSFLAHVREHGIPVSSADHAVSEALYLWDPDALGIEVYVDRPRSEWRMHGQELYMTTERLDVRAVLAAGEGRPWHGLAAGTVLGHMHLHVGDVRDAEAFYHAALGFDKMVWSYPGALFLAAGGYHHHLGTNTWAGRAPSRANDEAGLLEWEILLPSAEDVDAAVASVTEHGYSVEREEHGSLLRDPWGTAVRLIVDAR